MKNVPRTPDGKVDLKAPARRAPDGHPDLQGFWMPAPLVKYLLNLAADMKAEEIPLTAWGAANLQGAHRQQRQGSSGQSAACRRAFRKKDSIPDGLKRFVQTPTSVVLPARLAHDLPADLRRRPARCRKTRSRRGRAISTGKWEGDTLVVETIRTERQDVARHARTARHGDLRVIERFNPPGDRTPWTSP